VVSRLPIQSDAQQSRGIQSAARARSERRQKKDFTTMAHIRLPEGIPGILGPMAFSPETAKPLKEVKQNFEASPISEKLKALLVIAGQVRKGGKQVTPEAIECARNSGATDKEIHDAVLIAAAFCMFNRYVDGLATWAPEDPAMYRANGKRLAEEGYVHSTDHLQEISAKPRAANG